MKRLYDISKAILKALSSVRMFARDLGEPVRLTDAECAALFDSIRQDALNGHRAYLVVDIKKKDITFTHNTEGVIEAFLKEPNATNEAVATTLKLSKETVNTYNRQILVRARDAFPTITFKNLKAVIEFVEKLGLLSNNSDLINKRKEGF